MMKRYVFLVIVLMMGLTACGGSGEGSNNGDESVTNTATATATVTVPDVNAVQATATQIALSLSSITPAPTATYAPQMTAEMEMQALPDMGGGGEADEALDSAFLYFAPPAQVGQIQTTAVAISGLVVTPQPEGVGDIQPTPGAMTFDDPGTNPFLDTADDNLSTFAMDVDTGSYTITRNFMMNYNQLPDPDAVRPEEFINYFDGDYDSPSGDDAFGIYLTAAPAPFGYDNHYLMRVGLQGKYIAPEDRDPALLIFVIDVSGSMDMENRLGTVKESLKILVDELREDDRIGIVIYETNSRAILDPTPASERETILGAIEQLYPMGSTNVEHGLRIGYAMAEEHMQEDEITRIIVLSDGVANVGATGPDAILETIREGVDNGITLSTIGFGMGNYNDVLMEQLANDGNGNYYYVDSLREARRIFVHNLTGTLQVIGYDAKVQVEFHADVTDRYRLIGYENRAIADEDFRNDTVDAGEVGAGHSVTALYELALQDDVTLDDEGVIATVYIRYEDADTREVVEVSKDITLDDVYTDINDTPPTFRLHAAVAEFAEILRGSIWAEDATFSPILALVEADDMPESEDVEEFKKLVQAAISYGPQ